MRIAVLGGGGAIGGHLVKRLLADGHEVHAVDIKPHDEWWQLHEKAENVQADVRLDSAKDYHGIDLVFHLAADMGGIAHISNATNDAACLIGNTEIDLNVFKMALEGGVSRLVYASSACVYNEEYQNDDRWDNGGLEEKDAYPAAPDTAYGWEKLYAERMLAALASDDFRALPVRLHNVYGPHGSWTGGREKAPAALCRKVAEARRDGKGEIEVWGDGEQVRSFLYVDDAVEGLVRLAATDRTAPVNLGSDRGVSINDLAMMAAKTGRLFATLRHVEGPQGVRSRNADLTQLSATLDGWRPPTSLEDGIAETYRWVESMVLECERRKHAEMERE